ncbi:MAG: hypothetical protein N3D10_00605 [Candidatus Micrarchaeota archaeon]|nr:hypothetical protein [Candidatus Micrarchaeota archaeon]
MAKTLVYSLIKQENKKGQMQLVDLIVSLSIFLLLILFLYINIEKNIFQEKEKLKKIKAIAVADRLIKTIAEDYGYPTNWAIELEPSNNSLKAFGTAESYLEIDPYKLARFNQIYLNNYTKKKLLLGEYEADLTISYLNGTQIAYIGNYSSQKILTNKKSYALYLNQPIILKVRVWQK